MKAGQRPMPTALKLLRGNPGKQRLPANEPQPEQTIEVPDPPRSSPATPLTNGGRSAPSCIGSGC